jgi:hypothetical protein
LDFRLQSAASGPTSIVFLLFLLLSGGPSNPFAHQTFAESPELPYPLLSDFPDT